MCDFWDWNVQRVGSQGVYRVQVNMQCMKRWLVSRVGLAGNDIRPEQVLMLFARAPAAQHRAALASAWLRVTLVSLHAP